ncbi:MAG: hypothetical protein ABID09_07430 [Candidatus Omnitrophota bacterium]
MVLFVRLFGIVVVIMGIIFLRDPKALGQYVSFWKQKKRLQAGGILATLFGIVFLIAAPVCRLTSLITVLGIWSIIKGVLLLTLGQKKLNAYIDWWLKKPVSWARSIGILALAFGILLIYAA